MRRRRSRRARRRRARACSRRLVGELAERLVVEAVDARREHLHAVAVARLRQAGRRSATCAWSRCSFSMLALELAAAARAGARGARPRPPPTPCSVAPICRRRCSRSCTQSSAPPPVIASMRRTPAATPLSPRNLKRPMSPVRCTCVPPHSSIENVAHLQHAHAVAVLVAEERQRAALDRVVVGHLLA